MPNARAIDSTSRSHGFTLIELMVTIAVAAVLLSIAVPSFSRLATGNRLTTQANELIATLNLARSEAIKRNNNVTLCRATSDTASTCAGSSGAWQHWILRSSTGAVIRRGVINTFGGGIGVKSTLTNDAVVFGPDGLGRTGTALVNDQNIAVCAPKGGSDNIRRVVLGSGSRLSTATASGTC